MTNARAVIGSCFGDEGKGVLTDFLCARSREFLARTRLDPQDTVVVRHSGGANAGHTVVTPDGKGHVFSHFGSGSMLGCATFLSEFFVINPYLFLKELKPSTFGGADYPASMSVLVDPMALVTSPFDMFINRELETWRGVDRHGSVGVGIHETMRRSGYPEFRLLASDLWDDNRLERMLRRIKSDWVRVRLAALGIDKVSDHTQELIASEKTIETFVQCAEQFRAHTILCEAGVVTSACRGEVIFEGSQGLLLDQGNEEFFPHVTHASTGLTNVVKLAAKMGISSIDVTYVMRAYMTRHGAGLFPTEFVNIPGGVPMVINTNPKETNVGHEYAGHLRYGALDLDRIGRAISADKALWTDSGLKGVSCGIAVTCLDQVDRGDGSYPISYFAGEKLATAPRDAFLYEVLPAELNTPLAYEVDGPTRLDVYEAGRREFTTTSAAAE